MTIRVPESHCLNCGTQLDAVSQVAEKGEPLHAERPTETELWFTVCIKCGHLMAVTPELQLRELTDAEQIGLAGDRRLIAINNARAKVLAGYPDEEWTVRVCKIGQGAACCRYLTMHPHGWSCEKHGGLRAHLDMRVAAGTIRARGDNCAGKAARR
jgi:hypothetical protein